MYRPVRGRMVIAHFNNKLIAYVNAGIRPPSCIVRSNRYCSFRERKYDTGIPARAATSARKEISGTCLTRKKGE